MRRVSMAERLVARNRAEVEIMRFATPDPATGLRPHALWHKHVHNVTLDPVQILKMIEMDEHDQTIDMSCRRTGKTAVKELHILEDLATKAHQDAGIVAPRQQQSQNNLSYHLDAIRRSPILSAYLHYKNGRAQINDTMYQLANLSGAAAYGIMAQIDGDSLTTASLEETDDMPQDRLLSRFLPMLGAARRLGAQADRAAFRPKIRITGVFKGADVLQGLLSSGKYHCLPVVDVYLGMELGILNEQFMLDMRAQLPEGEFIRQFLCKNVASQNWIWERHIRRALAVGLSAQLAVAGPLPGGRYRKRGILAFGYDHTGHGESAHASRSALVVSELVGNFCTFPYVRSWPAGTDDRVIERDLAGLWGYFRPDYAIGDAYGVGMLTTLNDRLFRDGLTDIDRRTVGEGESTASTWPKWPFSPIRFEGMTKHSMASVLRSVFHNGTAAIPFVEEAPPAFERGEPIARPAAAILSDPAAADLAAFVRQLANIRAEPTKTSYSTFKMADPKLGDDFFDAACAAVWALLTRGQEDVPTVIGSRVASRDALLGLPGLAGLLIGPQARLAA
ncbi:MAG: hypothetical protein KJ007_07140 [Burkholderiales bacterium]|nr:hypothetical protein [Burkholderiales bacterium]